ncbi:hypothetical protein HMPREF9946_03019 [Acetobacteraceae bacterium AT-5844]|nr:hypothetical protein HMPREF9946_03019 [Acetobacteraceae bacterium AT-5844]
MRDNPREVAILDRCRRAFSEAPTGFDEHPPATRHESAKGALQWRQR